MWFTSAMMLRSSLMGIPAHGSTPRWVDHPSIVSGDIGLQLIATDHDLSRSRYELEEILDLLGVDVLALGDDDVLRPSFRGRGTAPDRGIRDPGVVSRLIERRQCSPVLVVSGAHVGPLTRISPMPCSSGSAMIISTSGKTLPTDSILNLEMGLRGEDRAVSVRPYPG